jgi:hypothetical protein
MGYTQAIFRACVNRGEWLDSKTTQGNFYSIFVFYFIEQALVQCFYIYYMQYGVLYPVLEHLK